MRIHFTYFPPQEKAGEIDDGMLRSWDAILDLAEAQGLAVLPVLGVWADWNDGSNGENWHNWDKNPFNAACGGPARQPRELFEDGICRELWFRRLEIFVQRWAPRRAIVGWEIYSELNLVTGATEDLAVAFTERAASVVRAADPWKRPITASQAGMREWPKLMRSPALDLISIHPYADGCGGRLDELILSTVRPLLAKYGKPVLIGESGLNSSPPRGTLDTAPRAGIGVGHAIWMAMVSGAMNGRALWWQDGYDQFEQADLCRQQHRAAAMAAAFVKDVDFSGFEPVPCELSAELRGAVLGTDRLRLGWFRDARCAPPDWPERSVAGEVVTMKAPGKAWRVETVVPETGEAMGVVHVAVREGVLRLELPVFQGAVALRLVPADGS